MSIHKNNRHKINKKKRSKKVEVGIVHIQSTFNNIIATVSSEQGDTLTWGSSGSCGFRGTKKTTPYAAQKVVSSCVRAAVHDFGLSKAEVRIKGVGPGRDAAIRGVPENGVTVTKITDMTPQPHNGCRPPAIRKP